MTADRTKELRLSTKQDKAFISTGYTNWKKGQDGLKKHETSKCHQEACEVAALTNKFPDIGETLSDFHTVEKANNRQMFLTILQNIRHLARQGIPFRGNDDEGNFDQLLKRWGENDSRIEGWLKKNSKRYTHGSIQNECLRVLALTIQREILDNIQNAVFYTLIADEVTDCSNKEQFVIGLRHVDNDLTPHDDFIGQYQLSNTCLKNVLTRMNLSIRNCRGQCCDGASNMVGAKKGVATEIQKIQPRAILTHCYGHFLQLTVGDTVKQIKILRDMFDTTSEISKLFKYSPERNSMFHKLKDELVPEIPDFRTLCSTRWTMRAASLQSVVENLVALQELWDDVLETKLDAETKGRVIGAKYQIGTFEYFYCVSLGVLVLKHSDNLSKTLPTHIYFCQRRERNCRINCQNIAESEIR